MCTKPLTEWHGSRSAETVDNEKKLKFGETIFELAKVSTFSCEELHQFKTQNNLSDFALIECINLADWGHKGMKLSEIKDALEFFNKEK